AGRRDVVGLVDDEQVEATGVDGLLRARERLAHESHRSVAFHEVNRRDEAGEVRPWVDAEAAAPAKLAHPLAVDDAELEAELVPHLVAPLELQAGRGGHPASSPTATVD